MKRAVVLGLTASLIASGTAYGFWTTSGTGTGTSSTPAVSALTLTPGTPTGAIYPGGTSDVATTITNPNAFGIRVGSLAVDTAQGTNGFTVDSGHSGCGPGVLSFAAQTNSGVGWTVPAGGSLTLDLAGALSMTTAAADACQGATFTVHLTARPDYATTVRTTPGLISYWRLGTGPSCADTFTGTAGTTLTAHTAAVSTPWTIVAGTNPVLTSANRLRRAGTGWALVAATTAPASADYSVQADVVVQSLVAADGMGVAGRLDTTSTSYYSARYRTSDNTWRLMRTIGGTDTTLGSAAATLTPGSTYRLRLDMTGSALALSVNGIGLITATDSTITATGRAGLQLGVNGSSAAVSDSTGLQVDTFRTYPNSSTTAADSAGSNTGTFAGTVIRNEPGALAGDLDGSAQLDGSTGYLQVTSPSGLPVGAAPRSVELWFNRTSTADQALFSYGSPSNGAQFSARLTSATNLRLSAVSPVRDFTLPYGTSDGVWHHVVVTYDGAVAQVYLDGTAITGQTMALSTTLDATGFAAGAMPATGTMFFAGSLDEIAVYGQVLPAATILSHYRIGHGS